VYLPADFKVMARHACLVRASIEAVPRVVLPDLVTDPEIVPDDGTAVAVSLKAVPWVAGLIAAHITACVAEDEVA